MADSETSPLTERLALLEQWVQRAMEHIKELQTQRTRLEREREEMAQALAGKDRELRDLRAQLAPLPEVERELARLRKEREEMRAQVEGILKELEKLGI